MRFAAEGNGYGGKGSVEERVAKRLNIARSFEPYRTDQTRFDDRVVEIIGKPIAKIGFVTTYSDVTERVRTAQALEKTEARLSDYADSASDWFWELDENLRFVLVTDSVKQFNGGIDPATFYGMTRREFNVRYNVDSGYWAAHFEDLDARRPFKNFEYGFFDYEGTHHEWSISGRPFYDTDGTFCGYRGVGRDITDRVLAQNEINRQRNELVLLNQQKNKFFSVLAHDLKTPFNIMMGYADLIDLRAENLSREKLVEMARSISSSSHNLFQLLEDLLAWGQSQMDTIVVKQEFVPSKEIFESGVRNLLESAQSKNITIELLPDNIELFVDREMMIVVIRNLVSNAVKFTPAQGRIVVKAETTRNGSADGEIVISVSDTGVGMSEAKIRQLFQIQTNDSTVGTDGESGTGLGLLLCKEFVENQGGQINVSSKGGEGTTFNITLPLAPKTQ